MKKRLLLFSLLIVCVICAFGTVACSTGHKYTDIVTAPTCVAKGYTTHVCDCGEKYVDSYTEKIAHKFTNYVKVSALKETAECDYGCGAKDTRDVNTIVFKTFDVTNKKVYGKVTNTMEVFDFTKEIIRGGKANFVVSLDPYGIYACTSKTAPLYIGDNQFYVFETVDDEVVNTYDVVIRRLDMYTITFDSNGGTPVETQIIEEDSFANLEIPVRAGYVFDGWGYDFDKPIKQSMDLIASWKAMFTLNGGIITDVTSAGKTLTEIVIPEVIDGVTIIEIADWSFTYSLNLQSVVIPDTVTKIGNWAFDRCFSLESVIIPSTVTFIGNGAFADCSSLKSIVLPDGLDVIGFYMFRNCTSLSEIVIPASVKSFGYDVFKNCTSLETITFKGTIAEWNKLYKGLGWMTGSALNKIICLDGEVNI